MATYGHLSTSHTTRGSRKCCGFSPRFIHYVLFIFNFIFFMSGALILLLTLLYGTRHVEFGDTRLNTIRLIISQTHMVNLLHYSMVVCGFTICVIALINAVLSCRTKKKPDNDTHLRELNLSEAPLTSTRNAASSSKANRERYADETDGGTSICLCIFIFTLLFLFTLQLIIGVISFITVSPNADGRDEFVSSITENLNSIDTLESNRDNFNDIQQYFKCCGWKSFDDYQLRNKSDPTPDSCCKTIVENCGRRKHPSNIYYDGCAEKVGPILKEYIIILGSVAFGFSIIEIFGLIFSCCLYIQLASVNR